MSVDQYYTLGRTGLRVSRLALGTMTFGTDWGWGVDEAASRAVFDRYLAAGGNFIDTAENYTNGHSERMVGKFMRESGARDRIVLATKYSFGSRETNANGGGNHRKNMMRAVEGSLKRLGADYIDLYWMHVWDQITPVEEVMRTFDDLIRAGKIRYAGLSNVPSWYASRAQTIAELRGSEPIAALQYEYSLVERNIEREYSTLAQQLGMGIVAWSPLASGLLSGRYKLARDGVSGEGRLDFLKDTANPAFNKFTEINFRVVAEVEKAAAMLGRSMSQIALNWAANRPGVASLIFGATKVAQLEDNLQALDFELPAEIAAKLEELSRPPLQYPYNFVENDIQGLMYGGAKLGDKPDHYFSKVRVDSVGARVGN